MGGKAPSAKMKDLFDGHCHLQDDRIAGSFDAVRTAARDAGVQRFSVNGTCEDDWCKVRALAERCPDVTPNFGLHPWFVAGRSQHWLQRLREALEVEPAAGLGECGLDKAHQGADMAAQEQAFRQQLQLGKELGRPISVHCVRAYGRVLAALQELGPFPAGLVLHSFAGPAEMVAPLAKVGGAHFSISGHITKLPVDKAAAMLKEVPLDRLLLETDSPDGLPQISDAHLARKVEAAVGCGLRVLTLSGDSSSDDRDRRSGTCSSGKYASPVQRSTSLGCGSATHPAPNDGSGGGKSSHGERQAAPTQAAADAGSNCTLGSKDMATIPLDWRCPLDVAADSGASARVENPWHLLNQPANLRIVLHLVAELRGQAAEEVAAASAQNFTRLFGSKHQPPD